MTTTELALPRPAVRRFTLLGPAFVAAVAYIDPGNFATNSAAGATYGHLLVWVVVSANLMAILVQTLSAKLGLATGMSLPEVCRERCPRAVTIALWVQAELVAVATDVAEVIGGALGLYLLTGVPLLPAGMVVVAASFVILALRNRGARRFEAAIAGLLAMIVIAFALETVRGGVDPAGVVAGIVPRLAGGNSVLLAVGILGATVMPHIVYAHSALVRGRYPSATDGERREALRAQRIDVAVALGLAGAVNLAILVLAAGVFDGTDGAAAGTLVGAHAQLGAVLGPAAAALFAVALLASGLASTSVGTYAGEIIMAGFLRRRIPMAARRMITVVPALLLLAFGVEPTFALVLSQAILSFGIPFALVPLVWFTRRRDVMGALVNRRSTTVVAAVVTALIVALNAGLVLQL